MLEPGTSASTSAGCSRRPRSTRTPPPALSRAAGRSRGAHSHLGQGDVVPDGVVINRVPVGAEHDTGKQRALLFYNDERGTAVAPLDLATNELGPTSG
jgi:hypothetical protein